MRFIHLAIQSLYAFGILIGYMAGANGDPLAVTLAAWAVVALPVIVLERIGVL